MLKPTCLKQGGLVRQGGFGMLELLVACVLSFVLIASLFQVYLTTNSAYRKQADLAERAENIRVATQILVNNIRSAGYAGCARLQDLQKAKHYTEHASALFNFTAENSLRGFTSQYPPAYLQDKIIPGNDILVVQSAASSVTRTYDSVVGSSFLVAANPATPSNKVLLLSTCQNAELFTSKETGGQVITLQNDEKLRYNYAVKEQPEVGSFTEIAYFIGDSGSFDVKGAPLYSLYEVINRGNKEEVLGGVNSMQIRYGIDLKGRGVIDNYLTAAEVDNLKAWIRVKSVKITLQLRSNLGDIDNLEIYAAIRGRLG
ncbi:MAG: PilW family protein [Gammaproteobacteria bacterium]